MFKLFNKSSQPIAPSLEETEDFSLEESSGVFDPVPANSTIGVCGQKTTIGPAHDLEARIQRRLMSEPGLHFKSLTVRRTGNGAVCIDGVLTGSSIAPDIDSMVQEFDGVQKVINHLLVCQGEGC